MKRLVCCLLMVCAAFVFAGSAWAAIVIKVANAGPDVPDNRTVKAVDIFFRRNRIENPRSVDVSGQRQLHENAVDPAVDRQRCDQRQQRRLAGVSR